MSETTTFYKVTDSDGRACHGGELQYSLPTCQEDGSWVPGEWHHVEPPIDLCSRGLHVTNDVTRWLKPNCRVWAVETPADNVFEQEWDKRCYRSIRLTRECPDAIPQWWRDAESFIASLAHIPWFDPQGEPDPAWCVFGTRAEADVAWGAARVAAKKAAWNAACDAAKNAAYDAARDVAWGAARDAAWDAAWNVASYAAWNAAYDAARAAAYHAAYDAAYDAASDAAKNAAWAAAKNDAWNAAWNVAWDAAAMCALAVLPEGAIDQNHVQTLTDQWSVWQRGFGLAGEANGTMYVYRRLA